MPPPASYGPDLPGLVLFPTVAGDTVAALYHPVPGATHTVLFAHGNAEDIGHGEPFVRTYAQATGASVLAFDYPGYGLSTGSPSERSAYEAADAALAFLRDEKGAPTGTVVAHGRSLGGAVLVDLAARERLAALVIESSFVSAFRVVTRAPFLPFDRFRSLDKLPAVDSPVLVIHGEQDDIVPLWHGHHIYDALPSHRRTALWVAGAGHNDLPWVAGPGYWTTLSRFMASAAP